MRFSPANAAFTNEIETAVTRSMNLENKLRDTGNEVIA